MQNLKDVIEKMNYSLTSNGEGVRQINLSNYILFNVIFMNNNHPYQQ